MMLLPPPAYFTSRKARILEQLAVPDSDYKDLSPKGSVDAGIRELIDELNALDGFVTTSSCAGRVSVFLEGRKDVQHASEDDGLDTGERGETRAGVGGKGGGGTWLFVSHDPVEVPPDPSDPSHIVKLFGLDAVDENQASFASKRLIHFKFEPMVRRADSDRTQVSRQDHRLTLLEPCCREYVLTTGTKILHVLTASTNHAQLILKCALEAGFRESGALNIFSSIPRGDAATPMVAVRTMGLSFESLVGFEDGNGARVATASPSYLRTLLDIGNDRFKENAKRIARFRQTLVAEIAASATGRPARVGHGGAEWEDAAVRKERKKAEGLRRKAEIVAGRTVGEGRAALAEGSDAVQADEGRLGDVFPSNNALNEL